MREKVFAFGNDACLVGVLTEPDPAQLRRGAPTVIVSNVGLNHRVGPFRMWVEMARELAANGVPVFRFDLSGLGDSEPRRDARPDLVRAADDYREALEFVAAKTGATQFALIGLCSGVDQIHAVTVSDRRVTAAAYLDAYSYPTLQFRLRRHVLRYLRPALWKYYLTRRLDRLRGRSLRREVGESVEIYVREDPPREQFERELSALARRGVRLLFTYSGGVSYRYNYVRQFSDMLRSPDLRGVEVEIHQSADHTYSVAEDRRLLIRRLRDWMLAHPQRESADAAAVRQSA
jgi:hypothetical protein